VGITIARLIMWSVIFFLVALIMSTKCCFKLCPNLN
jgi:hypothetical protein